MNRRLFTRVGPLAVAVMVFLSLPLTSAYAEIDGLTGTTSFSFTAKSDYVSGADGLSLHIWGFANGAGRAQRTLRSLFGCYRRFLPALLGHGRTPPLARVRRPDG